MKRLLPFLFILFLSSCTVYYMQLVETQAPNLKVQDSSYVYENDTVKITYLFWADKGAMAFSVYNKTEVPFYIDWKNSAFIYNGNKLDYWTDVPEWNLPPSYLKYERMAPMPHPVYGMQDPTNQQQKNERLTFIPPHSYSYRSKFYLLPVDYLQMNPSRTTQITVPRSDNLEKQTTVYEEKFDYENSPLAFRNFIAIKFSENTDQLFYYDNEFYLSSVRKMDMRHFNGKAVSYDWNYGSVYKSPFESNISFYLDPFHPIYYRGPYWR